MVFGEHEHYDVMFSGTSHARIFSRYKNHIRVEKILGKSLINIGKGGATCGVNEQFFFLKYFYDKQNSVDQLVYFLSTAMLFSDILPVSSNSFNDEPFSFSFFFDYMKFPSENKGLRLLDYCRSKLKWDWITLKPQSGEAIMDSLTSIDSTGFQMRMEKIYDPHNLVRFNKSCNTIEREIQFARDHHIEMIFILPPALFGKWPGQDKTLEFAKKMYKKYGVRYYDFSESVLIPQYYYDHQHLNTLGIVYFTEKYLKPVLSMGRGHSRDTTNTILSESEILKESKELLKK